MGAREHVHVHVMCEGGWLRAVSGGFDPQSGRTRMEVRGEVRFAPDSSGHMSSESTAGRPEAAAHSSVGSTPARPQSVAYLPGGGPGEGAGQAEAVVEAEWWTRGAEVAAEEE